MTSEKRRYRRYLVSGAARFSASASEIQGELLDVGTGGLLIRSATLPPKDTHLSLRFSVSGFDREFTASGRVVRSQLDVLAVMFLNEPAGLEDLLRYLENR